jgi:uncharacterized RDD family membrane protein YckC
MPRTGLGSDPGAPESALPSVLSASSEWELPEELDPTSGHAFGGFAVRLVAYLIDWSFVVIVLAMIFVVGSEITTLVDLGGDRNAAYAVAALIILAALLVGFGYFPWFWARGGQTPGMRLFALKVVRDTDGGPVSAGGAMLRLVGYGIAGALVGLGYIWIFIDERRRGWHDLLAGTCVIRTR